jgi:hypothetical protein
VLGGLCDDSQDGAFGNFLGMKPNRYAEYFDDFYAFRQGANLDWLLAMSAASATAVAASLDEGAVLITNVSAGATDETSIQWQGAAAAVITPMAWTGTQDFFFGARLQVDSAANTQFLAGLTSVATAPIGTPPANGIFFLKPAGGQVTFRLRKATVNTDLVIPLTSLTVADATYVELVAAYTVVDGFWRVYANGVLVGSISTASVTPTVLMTYGFSLLNASAAAHTLTADWLLVAKTR